MVGTYDRRVWNADDLKHEAQVVDLVCNHCHATHRVICEQGRPREHIATFGRVHFHGDVLPSVER